MRKKMCLIIFLIMLVAFFSGITYSFFHSNINMVSSNRGIASFIFETNKVDYIDLNLSDFVPGQEKEFLFSVTNISEDNISDVTIEYQLSIKTYHFMPLEIDLYKLNGEEYEFIGTCDESSSRNSKNELVCHMGLKTLMNSEGQIDDYKLKVIFPTEYDDSLYSNLVDYINIQVESWQKI